MPAPAYREQVLVVGRKLARALVAGAAAAARELAEQERRPRADGPRATDSPATIAPCPSRLRGIAARSLYACFLPAVACLVLVLLNVELLLPAAWKPLFRLVAGATMLVGGVPLSLNRLNILTLLIEQLTRRGWQTALRSDRVRGWRARLLNPLLHLTGLVMLAAAAFELARAIPHFA